MWKIIQHLVLSIWHSSSPNVWNICCERKILYPLLNFLKGGRITLRLFTTQCLPTLTLARSPLMMQSFMTIVWRRDQTQQHTQESSYITSLTEYTDNNIFTTKENWIIYCQTGVFLCFSFHTLPLRTIFWLPHSTDCLLTLLPEAWNEPK